MKRVMKYFASAAFLLALCSSAQSQEIAAGVHVSWLAIGGGTFSTNRVSSIGVGARLMYSPAIARGHARVTANYTAYPRREGSAPPISTAGLELAAIASPRGTFRPYAGIGAGFIRFSPRPDEFPPCDPELGCMSEGAPIFRAESSATLRPFVGLTIAVSPVLQFVGDLRVHLRRDTPWNGTQDQGELSAGLNYLLR